MDRFTEQLGLDVRADLQVCRKMVVFERQLDRGHALATSANIMPRDDWNRIRKSPSFVKQAEKDCNFRYFQRFWS